MTQAGQTKGRGVSRQEGSHLAEGWECVCAQGPSQPPGDLLSGRLGRAEQGPGADLGGSVSSQSAVYLLKPAEGGYHGGLERAQPPKLTSACRWGRKNIPPSGKRGNFTIFPRPPPLWMSKAKRFSLFSSSEAENGVEEKKKVCRSPTAQSPTPSSEAESPDPKRAICLR